MNHVLSASSDSRFSTLHFHGFDPLKNAVRGCGFVGDKMKHGMCEELRRLAKNFVRVAYSVSHKGGEKLYC